ncbi:O-antigen ligase family protein [Thauera phenolivorans]|uniref:O-antigen ligase family protein n=1 Tax=Thauera phenolivorans TaxID=1792543 RepID=UPI00083AE360|nr:O-antigen ligase family protein [Thauera phenolivorans]
MVLPETHRQYLYYFNSLAAFWFFAFIIVGPKYSIASSALLLLSLITLPSKLGRVGTALKTQLPWILGIGVYCVYHIAYRYFEGLPADRFDPPLRYLAAIPILIYLQLYGFSQTALGLGAAAGCLIGGGAGIHEVVSGHAARAGSTIAHHPIPYGTLVALLATTAICCATSTRSLALRGLLLLGAAVGLVAAIYSGTRGLYPAAILGLSYLGYRTFRSRGVSRGKILSLVISLTLTASSIAYQFPTVERRLKETVFEIRKIESGDLNTSIGQRLQMWHTAIHLFSQNPVFGSGSDKAGRSSQASSFLAEHGYSKRVLAYDHFHNEYLHALAAHGAAGFMVLIGLFWGALRGLSAAQRVPVTTLLIVIAIEALTEGVFIDTKLTTAFIFLITLLRAHAFWRDHSAESALTPCDSPFRIPKRSL